MNESEFIKFMKDFPITDYIVTFKMFDDDKHFHFENQLLLVDSDMSYYWDSDWNEGQKYEIIGVLEVDCVLTMQITPDNRKKLLAAMTDIRSVMYEKRKVVNNG